MASSGKHVAYYRVSTAKQGKSGLLRKRTALELELPANVKDQAGLCAASARLVSQTFEVLSVTVWLLDEQREQFAAVVSTAPQPAEAQRRSWIAGNQSQ